jgi:serine/threonine-protein kinase
MARTDAGECELFLSNLRLSNLLDDHQIDEATKDFQVELPGAGPAELAHFLANRRLLTPFQAKALLQQGPPDLVVGPYVLLEDLGSGRMGTVYKSRSQLNDRSFAVKVLPRRDVWNIIRVRQEMHVFEEVNHPGVVPFVDAGTARGLHYLVWDLAEGEPLGRLVERQGKLEPLVAASYALQAAEALAVCHEHDIVHGLVQPSNLLLGPDGRVRLLDLGVSLLLTEGESVVHTLGKASLVASQLNCSSPETIIDWSGLAPASDQYSLGCVLYFLLTGRYPFEGKKLSEKIRGHQIEQPPPIRQLSPEAPEALCEVVERLLQKDPSARYKSVAEAAECLRRVSASGPLPSRPPPRQPSSFALIELPDPGRELRPPPRRPTKVTARPLDRRPDRSWENTGTILLCAAIGCLVWALCTVLRLY